MKSTIQYNIKPVLITQPTILGYGIDDRSGADLERLKFLNRNGKTYWLILEEYNKITKEVADKYKLLCIDLANELPKSSYYFYDFIHFTPKGAAKVGKIISRYLPSLIEEIKK